MELSVTSPNATLSKGLHDPSEKYMYMYIYRESLYKNCRASLHILITLYSFHINKKCFSDRRLWYLYTVSQFLIFFNMRCKSTAIFVISVWAQDCPYRLRSIIEQHTRLGGIYHMLPYSVDFKAPGELWNQMSKTVHGKYNFIRN